MQCKHPQLFLACAVPTAQMSWGLQCLVRLCSLFKLVQCHLLHDVCPASKKSSRSLLCVPMAPYTCSRYIYHIALVADCLPLRLDCKSPKAKAHLFHLGPSRACYHIWHSFCKYLLSAHWTPNTVVGTGDTSVYKPVKVPLLINLLSSEAHRQKPNKQITI